MKLMVLLTQACLLMITSKDMENVFLRTDLDTEDSTTSMKEMEKDIISKQMAHAAQVIGKLM